MSAVVPFDAGRPPAVFANRQSSMTAAAKAGVQASFAVIGYKGRNWRIKYRGEEELIKDSNGHPFPYLDVIVVGVSSAISKQFYEASYTEGSDESPDCFSLDGITPDPTSVKKQCATCAACSRNVWGSRVTDAGKKAKQCQDSRRVAVVPLADPENESFGGPMLLRIPPMSLNNLANYAEMLERKGAGLEYVATRLSFDYDVAYPLITFQALGWLSNEQAELVVGADGRGGICADPQIARILYDGAETSAAPAQPQAADPLAGPPPAVMAPAQAVNGVASAATAPAPTAAFPAPTAAASASSPVGHGPTAPTTASPSEAPKRARKSPFQATVIEGGAAVSAPAAAAPAPAPTTVPAAPAAAPEVVQAMPEDMTKAIDALLAMPA